MEAILLVGGQGTRLRPLTLTTPKPMLPLAGIPLVIHQLVRAREAGFDHVVLATSYRADMFEEQCGDGGPLGLALTYAVEAQPLGTGGAVRNAASHLTGPGPVVVLNGDVLGGLDLRALVAHHRRSRADVTLHVRQVEDPRAYGVVTIRPNGRVSGFAEKSDRPAGRDINAGTYVFSRPVLMSIPAGRVVSLERETFPALVRAGARVVGFGDDTYWLDIGTPASYVRGNCDLVLGRVRSAALTAAPSDALVLEGARVSDDARLSGGTVVGRGVVVGRHADLSGSVVFDRAQIGTGARIRDSVIGYGARVSRGAVVEGAIVPDGATAPDGGAVTPIGGCGHAGRPEQVRPTATLLPPVATPPSP
jgi:mannose-1-phosphate guanylyltransferase